MFVSELRNRLDEACNQHMMFHRASGEMTLPPELKIVVPYFNSDGTFYGYGDAYVYFEPGLDRFVIEQPPEMILGQ